MGGVCVPVPVPVLGSRTVGHQDMPTTPTTGFVLFFKLISIPHIALGDAVLFLLRGLYKGTRLIASNVAVHVKRRAGQTQPMSKVTYFKRPSRHPDSANLQRPSMAKARIYSTSTWTNSLAISTTHLFRLSEFIDPFSAPCYPIGFYEAVLTWSIMPVLVPDKVNMNYANMIEEKNLKVSTYLREMLPRISHI